MVVEIHESKPDPSVVQYKLCYLCGVTLKYVPADIKGKVDYQEPPTDDRYIICPNCNSKVYFDRRRNG